jgi:hypothetical protein
VDREITSWEQVGDVLAKYTETIGRRVIGDDRDIFKCPSVGVEYFE